MNFCGESHAEKGSPSTEHVKVVPPRPAVNRKRAFLRVVRLRGCLEKVVLGVAATRLIVVDLVVIPPRLVAVQVSVLPASEVSSTTVTGSHPLVATAD